jgi:hypothetical protein
MSKRSLSLIIVLLAAVIALAATLDALAPVGGGGFLTVFDLPFGRAPGPDISGGVLRAKLPRGVRAVAGVAALAGYGLLLRHLAAARLATLARALTGAPARLARHAVGGAAALVLIVSLILLAAISTIAGPLVPLLGLGLTLAALTGVVALALPLGQRMRAWAGGIPADGGALDQELLADMLTGLLAITLAALFPYVGTIALALAGLIGLGATTITRFGAAERWTVEPFEY